MNIRTTLTLVVLLLAVGLYFYFVESNAPSPGDDTSGTQIKQSQGTSVFADTAPTTDTVIKLTIERGKTIIELSKEDDDWFQTRPIRFPLNKYSVEAIIDDAAALGYINRFVPEKGDAPTLAQMGIEPPQAVLTLEAGNQATWTIKLGKNFLGGRNYVMLNDDPSAYVVSDALYRNVVESKVSSWRKTSLDAPKAPQANRITLRRAGQLISLEKIDGRWFLDKQAAQRASEDKVQELVDSLGSIWIDDFISDEPVDLSLYGLAQPRIELAITSPSGIEDEAADQVTLRIGMATDPKEEKYFATWSVSDEPSTVVFTIGKSAIEPFGGTTDDLRDPRVVTAAPGDVRELVIERPDQPNVHILRDGQALAFAESGGPGYGLDFAAGMDLLSTITKLESESYVDGYVPTTPPTATISLSLRGSGTTEQVKLYLDNESYLAVRGSETVAYRLPADDVAMLFEPLLVLRDKEVLDLGEANITALELHRDDGAVFSFTPGEDQWQLQGHDQFESDTLAQLLDALKPLRVKRWLSEPVERRGNYWITLTVDVADKSPLTLGVDVETGHAMLSDVDGAFEVSSDLLDLLGGEYRPRTVIPLTADQIKEVSVKDGYAAEPVTLSKDDQGTFVSDVDGKIDQQAVAGIFDALAGLRVKRFISPRAITRAAISKKFTVTAADDQSYSLSLIGLEGVAMIGSTPGGGVLWIKLDESVTEKLREAVVASEQ